MYICMYTHIYTHIAYLYIVLKMINSGITKPYVHLSSVYYTHAVSISLSIK